MSPVRVPTLLLFAVLAVRLSSGAVAVPQESQHVEHAKHVKAQEKFSVVESQDLVREIMELRKKVAQMEARARNLGWFNAKKMGAMGRMGAKSKMGGMGKTGAKSKTGGMAEMGAKDKTGGMGKMAAMTKMRAMGRKKAMGRMGMGGGMTGEMETSLSQASAEPGLPGISHALHVGATGFFLDHGDHLELTTKQAEELGRIQRTSVLAGSTYDRRIAEAEQKLWSLTGTKSPSIDKIRTQAKVIADLGVEKRMAFIQTVMKAVQILTPLQNKLLLGEDILKADDNTGKEGR